MTEPKQQTGPKLSNRFHKIVAAGACTSTWTWLRRMQNVSTCTPQKYSYARRISTNFSFSRSRKVNRLSTTHVTQCSPVSPAYSSANGLPVLMV
jgi:hypothetical protein